MAAVEFAVAVPLMLILMFGLSDLVQLARGHMRVQAAAMQIGQIVSQCEKPLNGADEDVLVELTGRLLGTFAKNDAQWRLVITAFGQDKDGRSINWESDKSGGSPRAGETALSPTLKGNALPTANGTPYVMGKNKLLYRVEAFASIDRLPLSRAVSLLSANLGSAIRFDEVRGEAVLTTRVPNTDTLKATAEKGCLK